MQDQIQRFMFDDHPVRGEIIHLNESFKKALERKSYTPVLKQALADAMLSVCMLVGLTKCNGKMVLQFQGEGALKLISVSSTKDLTIRGLIDWQGELETAQQFAQALKQGKMVLTYYAENALAPYQSIIATEASTIAEAMEYYFSQSEQQLTRLTTAYSNHHAAGILLQAMPEESDLAASSWEHITVLAETLTQEELLSLDNASLLRRLYHQEEVRVFEPEAIHYGCQHTREKIDNAILSLGKQEAMDIIAEQGKIEVTCEFCGRQDTYDAVDVENLFQAGTALPETNIKHKH